MLDLLQTLQAAQSLQLTEQGIQALDLILAHDRWKTEVTFAHEIKLEELRSVLRKGGGGASRPAEARSGLSEEDQEFNLLSSFGACNDKHIGLISKTKVWEGANERASKLFEQWYTHIQNNNVVPLKDLKEGRIKTLLLAFLWASGCAHRATKWPGASDIHLVESLKKDLNDRLSKFSKQSITAAYESLKVFWKEINDYEQCPFNVTFIAEQLDEAYEYVNEKAALEEKVDIKKSPLFEAFIEKFPQVPLETLEKYYIKNRYNFVAAGVGALRKIFTSAPPVELEHKFSETEWPKKWHIYLSSYEQKWPEMIKDLIKETEEAQKEWSKL